MSGLDAMHVDIPVDPESISAIYKVVYVRSGEVVQPNKCIPFFHLDSQCLVDAIVALISFMHQHSHGIEHSDRIVISRKHDGCNWLVRQRNQNLSDTEFQIIPSNH